MDYREQQHFLKLSRFWGASAAALVFAAGAFCAWNGADTSRAVLAVFAAMLATLAAFVHYTPNYLHLSVMAEKPARWGVKVRWRLIPAGLLIGMAMAHTLAARAVVLLAISVFLAINFSARKLSNKRVPLFLWISEFVVISAFLLVTPLDLLLGVALLAAITHLAVVTAPKPSRVFQGVVTGVGALGVVVIFYHRDGAPSFVASAGLLVLVSGLATYLLVRRAQSQTECNVEQAMAELMAFTGYPAERIWQLWRTSGHQLAASWKAAAIADHDGERLAEWYRENSELYLFDLSGYNLEYKRIRSNLGVLKLARGACLDYGAGNGEILLELAKRGHQVAYYDVEGITMRFARHRAHQRGLKLKFFHSKDDLAAYGREHGFDTVFSLDVLEHLPDLPGELDFLSSMLNSGGLLVFDVPAGATKSHPMHLNHQLDVLAYLRSRGLKDARTWRQRMPFRKEEKYFFRAAKERKAASVGQTTQPNL